MNTFPNQSSRRGVALVITLIMLSVVTITAVAFLSVARRERAAVQSAGEQADVRIAADAALNRARAHILAQMASYTSRYAPSMFVSTNFIGPYFRPGQSVAGITPPAVLETAAGTNWFNALTNVSYLIRVGANGGRPFDLNNGGDALEYRRMLANLFHDPRVPVVARVGRMDNRAASYEDRFYLDLNRNGRFDTNGLILNRDANNRAIGTNLNWQVGDPEWVGVLADPDRPHSGNNRFLYRIAYLVVPADRTVDLNFSHNQAREFSPTRTGQYLRNQGVGSWEMNLAGLFRDLNTNIWRGYTYNTNVGGDNAGDTFLHGSNIWTFRKIGRSPGRITPQQYFYEESRPGLAIAGDNVSAVDVIRNNFVDDFSDGPLVQTLNQIRNPRLLADGEVANSIWSGLDATNFFTSPFQLLNNTNLLAFGANRVVWTNLDTRRAGFAGQLVSPAQAGNATYNAYTYYRLLSSLGTDSSDGRIESGVDKAGRYFRRAKLNLDYQALDADSSKSYGANLVVTNGLAGGAARATTFVPWRATNWMRIAGDRLLRKELSNGFPELENFAYFDNRGRRLAVPLANERAAHGIAIAGRYLVTNVIGNRTVVSETNYTYSAQVHRLLQLAANLHETRTNITGGQNREPFPPHVYRPLFYRENVPDTRPGGTTLPVIRLGGLEEITDANIIFNPASAGSSLRTNWVDFDNAQDIENNISTDPSRPTRVNVFGIPLVVGTKQNQTGNGALGLPKFNEALWQTRIRVGRRLILKKPSRNAVYSTNLNTLSRLESVAKWGQYTIQVVNTAAAEAWNSYMTDFPADRPLRVIATNWTDITLYDGNQRYISAATPYGLKLPIPQAANLYFPVSSQNPIVYNRSNYFTQIGNAFQIGGTGSTGYKARWDANEYIPAINSNMVFGLIYNPVSERIYHISQTNDLGTQFLVRNAQQEKVIPRLTIAVTNRLIFAIVDTSFQPPRLLDFVNLKSGTVESNLFDNLYVRANGTVPGNGGDSGFDDGFDNTGGNLGAGAGSVRAFEMPEMWTTNINRAAGFTIQNGFENQFAAAVAPRRAEGLWEQPLVPGVITPTLDQRIHASLGLRAFLYGVNSVPADDRNTALTELNRILTDGASEDGRTVQVGFNPAVDIFLTDHRMANDPFVHYTKEDLMPGGIVYVAPSGYWKYYRDVYPAGRPPGFENQQVDQRVNDNRIAFDRGNYLVAYTYQTNRVSAPAKYLSAYAPWGTNANLGTGVSSDGMKSDMAYKDPQITKPSDWAFPNPTNAIASVGAIGRVHRGTPWQTVYFKSPVANIEETDESNHFGDRHHWKTWSGSYGTHPTNDWALADLFTTALNENAARGTISVNQTNLAAWSAILSGVPVLRRLSSDSDLVPTTISPAGGNGNSFLNEIVGGYTDNNGDFHAGIVSGFIHTNPAVSAPIYRIPVPGGGTTNTQILTRSLPRFESLGEICSVDTLSVGSPFLQDARYDENFPGRPFRAVPDEVIERIPQQILSLLKNDEPRYVVYAWAQTLRPAPGATITAPGPFFGMATNYVVTGEFATKTVLRFEGALTNTAPVTRNLRAVIEDHRVITTE